MTPGGRTWFARICSTFFLTASIVGVVWPPYRIRTIPWTTSSSSSFPTIPIRGWAPSETVATSRTRTGTPFPAWTTTSRMSSRPRISPRPRTVYDCSPSVTRWPPTFTFAFWIAEVSWERESPCPRSRDGSTSTWNCFVSPP